MDERLWQVPEYRVEFMDEKRARHAMVIPVINEGARIGAQLAKMAALGVPAMADVIIADGGSTDGSLEPDGLRRHGVRGLLVKTGPGRLSAQLRMAYAFCLRRGYAGVITIDGNDKDGPEATPLFIQALDRGVDYVQASRFIAGGLGERTPLLRLAAIRLVHAPLLSLAGKRRLTDTTQGFRAYSARYLRDPRVAPFRDVFMGYELLAYLSARAGQLGYNVTEVPTRRSYPADGPTPTKISAWRGNWELIRVLWKTVRGCYHP